jgi:hypothetical protein
MEAGSEARSDHEIERSAKDARFKQEIIEFPIHAAMGSRLLPAGGPTDPR